MCMNFFFNPLILTDCFFLGYVLAGYFFLPRTFCMKFFSVDRLEIINDL